MVTPIRKLYAKLTDYEICKAIAGGSIRGQWMDDEDYNNAEKATEATATDVLNKIDERRGYGYNFWRMFD